MKKISLALLWHMHQPCYKDILTGDLAMQWVRLHGTKDYFGMVALAREFPQMRVSINLVPSLLEQLLDYADKGAKDPMLRLTEKPAEALNDEEKTLVVSTFFQANPETMIIPHERYAELWEKARFGGRPAQSLGKDFSTQDIRDLQVWANLAWFHPIAVEEHEALRGLQHKGRRFSEQDKQIVISKQAEIFRQVIALHRKLQDEGRIEVTTTPYYHPILPLLIDMKSARVAMPNVRLPRETRAFAEDADVHVAKAVEQYERLFGRKPRGMWPSEGSVSPEILPLLAKHGFKWFATDEGNLERSIATGIKRDNFGHVTNADVLYRPYSVDAGGRELKVIFRDRFLSDLLGFHYQRIAPEQSVGDFMNRLESAAKNAKDENTLVSVILDGENAWEYYRNNGIDFLRGLYGAISSSKTLEPVTVGDYVEGRRAPRIEKLHSGSWINSDFFIWIGDAEDVKGWEYVQKVRSDLVQKAPGVGDKAALAKAWECLPARRAVRPALPQAPDERLQGHRRGGAGLSARARQGGFGRKRLHPAMRHPGRACGRARVQLLRVVPGRQVRSDRRARSHGFIGGAGRESGLLRFRCRARLPAAGFQDPGVKGTGRGRGVEDNVHETVRADAPRHRPYGETETEPRGRRG
jgi:alpha-amylase/alpha-mannosidase (GH57 family)